jgi:hypothetical protein
MVMRQEAVNARAEYQAELYQAAAEAARVVRAAIISEDYDEERVSICLELLSIVEKVPYEEAE